MSWLLPTTLRSNKTNIFNEKYIRLLTEVALDVRAAGHEYDVGIQSRETTNQRICDLGELAARIEKEIKS